MTSGTQQINLYVAELRPQRDVITLPRLGVAVVLLAVTIAAACGWQMWRQDKVEAELATLEERLHTQTQRTDALEREVESRVADAVLVRQALSEEEQLSRMQQLLTFMEQLNLANTNGYSEHMKDLSRASFPGVWVTEFVVEGDADRVSLQGFVTSPAMLPEFVGRLGQGRSALGSKSFQRLVTSRTDDSSEYHSFELESSQ